VALRGPGSTRTGESGHIGKDHAPAALAECAAATQIQPRSHPASRALELAAVNPLGHAELALNLLGSAIQEEPKADDRTLALRELGNDLTDACTAEPAYNLLLRAVSRINRIEPKRIVVERHRSPPADPLALVHRLVERRLRQVRAHLRRAHRR
jgi:hypothetical protein